MSILRQAMMKYGSNPTAVSLVISRSSPKPDPTQSTPHYSSVTEGKSNENLVIDSEWGGALRQGGVNGNEDGKNSDVWVKGKTAVKKNVISRNTSYQQATSEDNVDENENPNNVSHIKYLKS